VKLSSVIDELSRRNPLRFDEGDAKLSTDARDLLSAIVSTPRDHTATSPVSSRRHPTRPRRILLAGAVAAVAASSLAVAGVFTTPKAVKHPTITHLSAVAFLDSAVKEAVAQLTLPSLGAGQYYYEENLVLSMSSCQLTIDAAGNPILQVLPLNAEPSGTIFNYEQPMIREEWGAADGSGAINVQLGGEGQILPSEQAAWKAAGAPSGCDAGPGGIPASGGTEAGPVGWTPLQGYKGTSVGELPTDPTTLGALLAAGRVSDDGHLSADNTQCPSSASDYPEGATVCSVSEQFDIAANLLVAPEGPERVGPALYQILTQLPGVEEIGQQTDALGRSGMAIEDPSTGWAFVIDPTTGMLLEEQQLETYSDGDLPLGAVTYAMTFGPASIVNSLGTRPAGYTGTAGNTGTSQPTSTTAPPATSTVAPAAPTQSTAPAAPRSSTL
jgi:hypothetical protein